MFRILLIIVLLAGNAWAGGILRPGSFGAAPSAFSGDTLDETFDANPGTNGCDDAGWGTGGDADYTAPALTGFSGECLMFETSYSSDTKTWDNGSGITVGYFRVRFMINTDQISTSDRNIMEFKNTGSTDEFRIALVDPSDNGNFVAKISCLGGPSDTGTVTFGTGDSVEIEGKWSSSANELEWYVNGTEEGTAISCTMSDIQEIEIGNLFGGAVSSVRTYWDNMDIDTSGYPTD